MLNVERNNQKSQKHKELIKSLWPQSQQSQETLWIHKSSQKQNCVSVAKIEKITLEIL